MVVTFDTSAKLLCGECLQDVEVTKDNVITHAWNNHQREEPLAGFVCPCCNEEFYAECIIKVIYRYGKMKKEKA